MLDRAQVPAGPRRPMIVVLVPGIVLSFVLGAGIGVLLELIDPVVLSGSHLEKIGSPALLGSIHRAV
jgi:capsular polysaccharide biosynthesis protein